MRSRPVVGETVVVAIVVLSALALRTYRLDSIPSGLHGDEAIAGIEGQRILHEGWIGPYSPLTRGQPAGPLYLVAPAVKVFGNTAFAVRLVPALMGTATVLALYLAVRSQLGRREALIAGIVLATMGWHLLFTRSGFPVGSWPLVTLLAAWALSTAVRYQSVAWSAVAGALLGAGIYVYNAHYVVIGAFVLIGVGLLVVRRYHPLGRDVLCAAAFAGALVVTAVPMARFASNPSNGYFQHFQHEANAGTPAIGRQRTPIERAKHTATLYGDAWLQLTVRPKIDGVDGSGIVAVVPTVLAALAVAGVACALKRWHRESLVWIAMIIIIVAPLAPALTNNGGVARRTLEMTPFVAIFAAVALTELIRLGERWGRRPILRGAAVAATAGIIAFCGWQGAGLYFTRFAGAPAQQWIYDTDFTAAVRFMATLKPGDYVYLASDRQSINYETRQFLAPDVQGEDIGQRDAAGRFTYFPARGRPVFILVGSFRASLPELEKEHPGGTVRYGELLNGSPAFIAYELE